jgi:malate synthase
VAHPDLVPPAKEVFDKTLGSEPNQKSKQLTDVNVAGKDLLSLNIEGGKITEAGLRNNINVALQYIESWLRGVGAAAIHNLMEDAATAEISRAQIWQWIKNGAHLDDGQAVTLELYKKIRDEEVATLTKGGAGRYKEAVEIMDKLVDCDEFPEFLTVVAYQYLDRNG